MKRSEERKVDGRTLTFVEFRKEDGKVGLHLKSSQIMIHDRMH